MLPAPNQPKEKTLLPLVCAPVVHLSGGGGGMQFTVPFTRQKVTSPFLPLPLKGKISSGFSEEIESVLFYKHLLLTFVSFYSNFFFLKKCNDRGCHTDVGYKNLESLLYFI